MKKEIIFCSVLGKGQIMVYVCVGGCVTRHSLIKSILNMKNVLLILLHTLMYDDNVSLSYILNKNNSLHGKLTHNIKFPINYFLKFSYKLLTAYFIKQTLTLIIVFPDYWDGQKGNGSFENYWPVRRKRIASLHCTSEKPCHENFQSRQRYPLWRHGLL